LKITEPARECWCVARGYAACACDVPFIGSWAWADKRMRPARCAAWEADVAQPSRLTGTRVPRLVAPVESNGDEAGLLCLMTKRGTKTAYIKKIDNLTRQVNRLEDQAARAALTQLREMLNTINGRIVTAEGWRLQNLVNCHQVEDDHWLR
jgi:hypothetical protein